MNLHLRWARFFTLAGWNWAIAPGNDLRVTIPCGHGECRGSHDLLVRVCEKTREALQIQHYELFSIEDMYQSPHPALFGNGPKNTVWQMAHGAGGGLECLESWEHELPEHDAQALWEKTASE